MELPKKLSISGNYIISWQNEESYIRICKITPSYEVDSKEFIKELVRKWNAFEKDELVDELLAACEYTQRLLLRGIGQHTHAVAMLEAAIASAKA